jgi:GAF domain-containing protein
VAVLPIAHRGAVVGVLYGDNARTRRPLQDLSGLEIFLSQAGLALENALSATARSRGTS